MSGLLLFEDVSTLDRTLTPRKFLQAARQLETAISLQLKLKGVNVDAVPAVSESQINQKQEQSDIVSYHAQSAIVFSPSSRKQLSKNPDYANTIHKNEKTEQDEAIDWDKQWNPKILIENIFGDPGDEPRMSITRDHRTGQATVCETRIVKGNFFQLMQLHKFPFDVQSLSVKLLSELDCAEVQLEASVVEPSGVSVAIFSAEQEWTLLKDIKTWNSSKAKRNGSMVTRHPIFGVSTRVSRKPKFFIWNIITMMFLTCSLSFATYTCSPDKPQFRLQLTFLLLLTTVTFKFAVNKNLPKIPYLTFLDKYILGSMFIQFAICVWHAVVGAIVQVFTNDDSQTTTTTTMAPVSTVRSSTVRYTNAAYTSNFTDLVTSAVMRNARTTTADLLSTVTTAATTTAASVKGVTRESIIADWIALGCLGGVYIVFQVVFLILITDKAKKSEAGEPEEDDG